MPAVSSSLLIVRAGSCVCGLPIESVTEVMRPLRLETLEGAPAFVAGVSLVRGQPTPVVDLGAMLGTPSSTTRWVSVRSRPRDVVIAVDDVIGVWTGDRLRVEEMPPLLAACSPDLVTRLGTLDGQLLLVLGLARILSEDVLHASGGGRVDA